MALREQTEAWLVGFDGLPASEQIATLEAIESDLRRALSADVPSAAWPSLANRYASVMRIGEIREASPY